MHPVVSSENIQKTLNSQTQLCFYLKATCFSLNIDHHHTEKHYQRFILTSKFVHYIIYVRFRYLHYLPSLQNILLCASQNRRDT
jgi:hypothetical protein